METESSAGGVAASAGGMGDGGELEVLRGQASSKYQHKINCEK